MPLGAPTCIGFRCVLLAMTISLSQVLQNQVSVLRGGQLHLTSCPTFPVHIPLYRCTERQSLPFLLASHLSAFAWGFQSVPPGAKQATQMREAPYVGRAASASEKVMEVTSRQPCAQLWPVITKRGRAPGVARSCNFPRENRNLDFQMKY